MRGRILSFGLAVLITVALSACGDTAPTATPVPQATSTAVVEPTNTAPEPTDTPLLATPTARAQAEPTSGSDTSGGSVTYDEIDAQREKLTDAQWPAYEKSIIGKELSAAGYVYDVQEELAFGDDARTQLDLSFEDSSEPLQGRNISAFIDPANADTLSKDQTVSVAGNIEKVECILSYCEVYLADATYRLTGDTLPPKEYPKLDTFEYGMIKEKRTELTEVQWKQHFVPSVLGAKMQGEGYVYDVAKRFDDENFDLKISFKEPSESLASTDLQFSIPADGASALNKGEQVTFEGNLKELDYCIFTFCSVVLENGIYTKK